VGIDLGTTNSALAYVDTEQSPWRVETLRIPQLVAPGQIEAREVLPSFHYEAAAGEFPAGSLRLPWDRTEPKFAIGVFARDQGAKVPGRLIASAKSWLCHPGVDRTAGLLPWQGADDVTRLSPVEVSARILGHLRAAWDHQFPQHLLAQQDVILGLPASFDEVARELTVKAAAAAGLKRVVLLEEPQAAFYAWIDEQGSRWEEVVQPGQKLLVCDIGGGTTDLTLIRVRQEDDGRVRFHRVAVGEHLILGGDNLDLSLAHDLEEKFSGAGKLPPRQWAMLLRSCRQLKETFLQPHAPERQIVHLPGPSSKLLSGGSQREVARDDVQRLLVDGFLPSVPRDAKPARRQSGFQEFGLPYAPDPAITKYLAAFLLAHRFSGSEELREIFSDHDSPEKDPAKPDAVLFNGGFFESPVLRERLLTVLGSWFSGATSPAWRPHVLEHGRLDLAVARGAAYYGMVRRGQGTRISAGLARTYYLGIRSENKGPLVVCLLPAGVEEGHEVLLESRFSLLIRQPVEFSLFVSSTRLTDLAGAVLPWEREQMTALPPIRTVLHSGSQSAGADQVTVQLLARLSEIGTLDLSCREADGKRSWKLQFDVRSTTRTDLASHTGTGEQSGFLDDTALAACRAALRRTFAPQTADEALPPGELIKALENAAGMRRESWPPTLLRGLWETLLDFVDGRQLSPQHEARWLNLLGYSLRPGYGLAVDDWRIAQTWRLFQTKKLWHPAAVCRVEWPILWRRIAGGLSAGQQLALAEPIVAPIRPQLKAVAQTASQSAARMGRSTSRRPQKSGKKTAETIFGTGYHETAEIWRLLGSLELLPISMKKELGGLLCRLLPGESVEAIQRAEVWALGRLGARVPLAGQLQSVVPAETAAAWALQLLEGGRDGHDDLFALMQIARKTGDRQRDLAEEVRQSIARWFRKIGTPKHYQELLLEGGSLDQEEQAQQFGEALPPGLRLT